MVSAASDSFALIVVGGQISAIARLEVHEKLHFATKPIREAATNAEWSALCTPCPATLGCDVRVFDCWAKTTHLMDVDAIEILWRLHHPNMEMAMACRPRMMGTINNTRSNNNNIKWIDNANKPETRSRPRADLHTLRVTNIAWLSCSHCCGQLRWWPLNWLYYADIQMLAFNCLSNFDYN